MSNSMHGIALASDGLYPQSKKAEPSIRKLALGILLQAFRDTVTPSRFPSKEEAAWRTDALEWFYCDEAYPGSIHWVCEILQTDVGELRRWLTDFKASDLDNKRKWARKLINFRMPKG